GNITVEGYTPQGNEDADDLQVRQNFVGPEFFSTMGIPLLTGRELSESDTTAAPKVAIVNETFAQHFFSGRSAVGGHFAFGAGRSVHPDIEIVGVVKDTKEASVQEENTPFIYIPYSQNKLLGALSFYVRTDRDPLEV